MLSIKEFTNFIPHKSQNHFSGICYYKAGLCRQIDKNKEAFTYLLHTKNSIIIILPQNETHIPLIPNTKYLIKQANIFYGFYKDDKDNVYNKESQTIELDTTFNLKSKLFINKFLKINSLKTIILKDTKTNKIYLIKRNTFNFFFLSNRH